LFTFADSISGEIIEISDWTEIYDVLAPRYADASDGVHRVIINLMILAGQDVDYSAELAALKLDEID
jgi:hypothetical protein